MSTIATTAAFMGRRLTTTGKLCYFWRFDGEEKPRAYGKQIAPALVGEVWRLTFTAPERELVYTTGEHAPIRGEIPEPAETVSRWSAEEAIDIKRFEDARARARLAKRKGQFERSIEPLRTLMWSLRTHHDRVAFAELVTTELWRR